MVFPRVAEPLALTCSLVDVTALPETERLLQVLASLHLAWGLSLRLLVLDVELADAVRPPHVLPAAIEAEVAAAEWASASVQVGREGVRLPSTAQGRVARGDGIASMAGLTRRFGGCLDATLSK